jgi:hypothetical protein
VSRGDTVVFQIPARARLDFLPSLENEDPTGTQPWDASPSPATPGSMRAVTEDVRARS